MCKRSEGTSIHTSIQTQNQSRYIHLYYTWGKSELGIFRRCVLQSMVKEKVVELCPLLPLEPSIYDFYYFEILTSLGLGI